MVCPDLAYDGILGLDFILTHGISMVTLKDRVMLGTAGNFGLRVDGRAMVGVGAEPPDARRT